MSALTETIVYGVLAYLLGSVPSAVWYGKLFFGLDVREHGSGNAGATNTLRVLGNKAGIIVLLLDTLKGYLASQLVVFMQQPESGSDAFMLYQIGFGFIAVLGHVFPVFAGFKGGKGIATLTGIVIALDPVLAILCFGSFVIIVSITRYISVGSMVSALLSPVYVYFLYKGNFNPLFYFCLVVSVLVIYTHRSNLNRLRSGTENRFQFRKKPQ